MMSDTYKQASYSLLVVGGLSVLAAVLGLIGIALFAPVGNVFVLVAGALFVGLGWASLKIWPIAAALCLMVLDFAAGIALSDGEVPGGSSVFRIIVMAMLVRAILEWRRYGRYRT